MSILFGDVSYYLGFVYMRSGKLTYARQELSEAIANYEKTTTTSAGSSSTGTAGDVVRRKIKNAAALMAFICEVVGDKEGADVAYRHIEDQSIGPIEDGKDEVTKLKLFIERKLPTSSQSPTPTATSTVMTSSTGSQSIRKDKEGKKDEKEDVENKSSAVNSESTSWFGGWIDDGNDLIAYSILFIVFILLITFFLPFLRDRGIL
eukprot:gene3051-3243_t